MFNNTLDETIGHGHDDEPVNEHRAASVQDAGTASEKPSARSARHSWLADLTRPLASDDEPMSVVPRLVDYPTRH